MEQHDTTPPGADAGPSRRGFLAVATVVLGAVPILGGLFATLRAGLAPAGGKKPPRIPLCKLSEVPADGIREIAISYEVRQGPVMESVAKVVFVTRDPDDPQTILVLSGECTHLSCPVQKRTLSVAGTDQEAPLTCPCHGGKFSRTGKVLAGPPREDLRRLTLEKQPEKPDDVIHVVDA